MSTCNSDSRLASNSTGCSHQRLCALLQEFMKLADEMMEGAPVEEGPHPPNLIDQQLSFLPGVVVDWAPSGANFLLCVCPPMCRLYRSWSTNCDGSEPLAACLAALMASAMQGYWSHHAGVTRFAYASSQSIYMRMALAAVSSSNSLQDTAPIIRHCTCLTPLSPA